MKAAAVALACMMRFVVPAQAGDAVRLSPAAPEQRVAHPDPPAAPKTWVDPVRAEPIAAGQPIANGPLATSKSSSPVPRSLAPETAARDAQRQRQCLNAVETRQTVASHRLAEPFRALRAGRQQGEALRAKLCRWKQDQFVYEVFVLRHDGRIVRVYMNAQNGQAVGALDDDRR